MELLNDLNNAISNELSNIQSNFLESTLGKSINGAINVGIRYVMPDAIEDDIIEVKDAFIKGGIKEGINTAINNAVEMGKNTVNLITGSFENIGQVEKVLKSGGLINSISSVIDNVVDTANKSGLINNTISGLIKGGKNIIMGVVSNNVENTLKEQSADLERLEQYTQNWYESYNNHDIKGMNLSYENIMNQLNKTLPIEKTIAEARRIETLHNFIKNNNMSFDVTVEQLRAINNLN